jgi:glycosyltransferase involved in cell wall biosynthesis
MNAEPTLDSDRIALIDPSNFTTPYDLALVGALRMQGRDVRLIGQAGGLTDGPVFYRGHFYPVLESRWARWLGDTGVRLVKGASHPFAMIRLINWLTAFEAGIVHFQWSPVPAIDHWFIRLLRLRAPVVMTLHDSNPYQGAAGWLMRRGYPHLLRSVDAIVVHTQQARDRVAALGIDPAVIHRIPHGLLGNGEHSTVRSPQPRSRDRLVLLQFGKIKPYKGVDLLLEALTLVPHHLRERLDVRIVGKPYMDTAGLEQFVRTNELTPCVTFRFEFVSEAELEELFAACDAILLPYREIDASGVAMSAIARGLPVLATAIDGFCELFQGKGGARLVTAADPAALASAISDWLDTPEQLQALSEAMRLRRVEIPGWDEIAQLHFAVYAQARERWTTSRRPQA